MRICTGLILAYATSTAATVSPLGARGFGIVPEPQKVELGRDDIRFGPEWAVEIGPGVSKDDVAVETLQDEMRTRFGLNAPRSSAGATVVRLAIRTGSVMPGAGADRDKEAIARQAYRLEIDDSGVALTANAPEGLFYGVESLAQLLQRRSGSLWLPQGRVTDWPDLSLRHIYWDDAHHLERLPELKRAVRQAAFFKINGFELKLEGHFQFPSAPAIVEPYALTPAEYQELTDYALRYHVQLVPYLDGPAHIAFILKHPEYARYRSFADSNYELCAVDPEAVRFLTGLFRDLIAANRGGKFVRLSTDEAYYVGLAQNPQCDEKSAATKAGGAGKLLARFIDQVATPLHDAGRTVLFWGEYPLTPSDIASLPSHLVNGEVYGPDHDRAYRQRGIRQMIYTYTQGDNPRFFPDYFALANSRRLHPVESQDGRLRDGIRTISDNTARSDSDLMGVVVAGWGDSGLHPETFWLGYATITAAGWNPAAPSVDEAAATFYRVFYGGSAVRMDRVYQLMSQQSSFWLDSWDWGPSKRKPLFGNSAGVFNPRKSVQDQTLRLPGADADAATWLKENQRRLQLAAESLVDNDELLGLLAENLRRAERNRYNLEVYTAIALLYRQNLEMILDIARMCSLVERGGNRSGAEAVGSLDQALAVARQIRRERNDAYGDIVATYEKSWFPRVREANGRSFLHDLDDVKDHVGDRTVDLSYMIQRQLQLPFGQWVESIRAARNAAAESSGLKPAAERFDWLDLGTRASTRHASED